MTTVKSLVEIGQGSRKFAIAKVLEKRDDVAKSASSKASAAIGSWKSVAPKLSGFTANNVHLEKGKYYSQVVPDADYRPTLGGKPTAFMLVVNAQNKMGKHKGFYDKYKKQTGQDFLTSIK